MAPERRATTSQWPRDPGPPIGTGTATARPASFPVSATNIACLPASVRSLTSARTAAADACEIPRSCGWRASSRPRSSSSSAAP